MLVDPGFVCCPAPPLHADCVTSSFLRPSQHPHLCHQRHPAAAAAGWAGLIQPPRLPMRPVERVVGRTWGGRLGSWLNCLVQNDTRPALPALFLLQPAHAMQPSPPTTPASVPSHREAPRTAPQPLNAFKSSLLTRQNSHRAALTSIDSRRCRSCTRRWLYLATRSMFSLTSAAIAK